MPVALPCSAALQPPVASSSSSMVKLTNELIISSILSSASTCNCSCVWTSILEAATEVARTTKARTMLEMKFNRALKDK